MIEEPLSKTKFSFSRKKQFIDVSCPWGNQIRVHAPNEKFGNVEIGLPYVEFFVPKNSAGKLVNFYQEIFGAKASIGKRHGKTCAEVTTGTSQYVYFIETNEKQNLLKNLHLQSQNLLIFLLVLFSNFHHRKLAKLSSNI